MNKQNSLRTIWHRNKCWGQNGVYDFGAGTSPIRFLKTTSSCTWIVCSARRSGFPCTANYEGENPSVHSGLKFCYSSTMPRVTRPLNWCPDLKNQLRAPASLQAVFSLQREMVTSLVFLLQPRDGATNTFPTSLAGFSLSSKSEFNARPQLDLWWFVAFYYLIASILGHVSWPCSVFMLKAQQPFV